MAKVSLKVARAGDPVKPVSITGSSARVPVSKDFDLRDRLSELAIRGNSLSPDDKAAIYGSLIESLGKDRAMKVMNHAYIFNSKPEVQRLSPEEKVKSFYTIGSNDPDIMDVITRTKNLGYGVLPGYRESISDLNQATQRGVLPSGAQSVNPQAASRVMLQIRK